MVNIAMNQPMNIMISSVGDNLTRSIYAQRGILEKADNILCMVSICLFYGTFTSCYVC